MTIKQQKQSLQLQMQSEMNQNFFLSNRLQTKIVSLNYKKNLFKHPSFRKIRNEIDIDNSNI